jgi:retron-type reverse transcriptase
MDKSILKQFLKAGYIFDRQLFQTDAGTPQGGIISPTLANMALDGISDMLKEKYRIKNGKISVLLTLLVNISDIALGIRPQTPVRRRRWRSLA